jgi:predicted HicB family RNase H-like nuclease
MNVMSYKGYAAHVEFDAEDDLFIGHVAVASDVVGFHADTVEGLKAAFHEAVDDYLATCEKIGKPPERACLNQPMIQISPQVHARAALAAELSGKSLGAWGEDALREAAAKQLGS